jgi:flagellar basal body P-ring protein FlgI
MHKKRVLSVSHGVLGVLHSAAAAVHAIGQGLAVARGLDPKHAVKQVDRMLSNAGIRMDEALVRWVRFVVGERKDIVVTLDWTDHAHDKQATIALNMVTTHGRATPLVWNGITIHLSAATGAYCFQGSEGVAAGKKFVLMSVPSNDVTL